MQPEEYNGLGDIGELPAGFAIEHVLIKNRVAELLGVGVDTVERTLMDADKEKSVNCAFGIEVEKEEPEEDEDDREMVRSELFKELVGVLHILHATLQHLGSRIEPLHDKLSDSLRNTVEAAEISGELSYEQAAKLANNIGAISSQVRSIHSDCITACNAITRGAPANGKLGDIEELVMRVVGECDDSKCAGCEAHECPMHPDRRQ